jgi:hypothetical protein
MAHYVRMRVPAAFVLMIAATPALAQFPPPGIYDCEDAAGTEIGTLSLLVAGDYQWDAEGQTYVGQIASSGTNVEALSGPLGDAKWKGSFLTQMDRTSFVFDTTSGHVTCE